MQSIIRCFEAYEISKFRSRPPRSGTASTRPSNLQLKPPAPSPFSQAHWRSKPMTVCLEKPRSWKDALKLRAAEMMGAMKAMQKARFSLPSICENPNNQFALIAKSWRREVKGNTLEVGAVLCGSRV